MLSPVAILVFFTISDLEARLDEEKISKHNFVSQSAHVIQKRKDGFYQQPLERANTFSDGSRSTSILLFDILSDGKDISVLNHKKKDLEQTPERFPDLEDILTVVGNDGVIEDVVQYSQDHVLPYPKKDIDNLDPKEVRAKRSSSVFKLSVPELKIPTQDVKSVQYKKDSETKGLENTQKSDNDSGKVSLNAPLNLGSREGTFRSTRSASQEQWIKQPYPVHPGGGDQDQLADAEGSDNMRAPKVHFVTQKRPGVGDFRDFDRERERIFRESNIGRGRDSSLPIERFRDPLSPDEDSERASSRERSFDRKEFYDRRGLPYPSHDFLPYEDDYSSRRPFSYYPSEMVYHNSYYPGPPRKRYGRRYERYRHFDLERDPLEKPKKQTRIIYYATLPEVARSPPKVDLRDRFGYHYDAYADDSYYGPAGFRDPYVPRKNFYDNDIERQKPHNSALKFSKDLAVKEPKKAPESRIYSETERRYANDYDRFPAKSA